MRSLIIVLFVFANLLACQSSSESQYVPKSSRIGQWRYVGKFSHLADYACFVCPNFDYDKSLYQLTFNTDGSVDTRINLLIGKATYQSQEQQNNYNPQIYKDLFTASGTFSIKNLSFSNRPPQTIADTEFIANLNSSNIFHQTTYTANQTYDELSLTYNKDNFLFFVRKR